MNIVHEMMTAQNGTVLSYVCHYYGLPHDHAKQAIEAAATEINNAIIRTTNRPNTLIPLLTMMGSGQLTTILDNPSAFADPATRQKGLSVLEILLGSTYGRHKMAQTISEQTRLPSGLVEHMLPTLAAVAICILHKKTAIPISNLLQSLSHGRAWPLADSNPFHKMARFIDERNKRKQPKSRRSASLRTLLNNLKNSGEPAEHVQ